MKKSLCIQSKMAWVPKKPSTESRERKIKYARDNMKLDQDVNLATVSVNAVIFKNMSCVIYTPLVKNV